MTMTTGGCLCRAMRIAASNAPSFSAPTSQHDRAEPDGLREAWSQEAVGGRAMGETSFGGTRKLGCGGPPRARVVRHNDMLG